MANTFHISCRTGEYIKGEHLTMVNLPIPNASFKVPDLIFKKIRSLISAFIWKGKVANLHKPFLSSS